MNRAETLTPDQRRAIETFDRPLLVTAGPGAGKTRVLVERVLYLLTQGRARLDEIVALTFTNRAANEMKQRIRQTLGQMARQSARPQDARRWHEARRQVETAAISTIHGFCARILRAHPVQAQVDPEFVILDEFTSHLLLHRAAEEVLQERIEAEDEVVGRLVIGYSRRGLLRALADLYARLRTLGWSWEEAWRVTERGLRTAEAYRESLARLEETVARLETFEGATQRMAAQIADFLRAFRWYGPLLRLDPRIEDAPLLEGCLRELRQRRPEKRGRLAELARELERRLEDVELTFYDVCAPEVIRTLGDLLERLGARYEHLKRERNGLDYEDLQWRVRALLRAHPEIAAAARREFRFLLVDEFQDTNALQKELIDLLLGEGPDRPHLFLVGDAKQSIYNFRGAAVEVFLAAQQEMEEGGGAHLVLEYNFRSTEPLVRFFNAFFARLMADVPQGEDLGENFSRGGGGDPRGDLALREWEREVGHTPFVPSRAHRPPGVEAPVEVLLEIGPHIENREQGRRWEAHRLADRLARMVREQERLIAEEEDGRILLRPVRYGDIAVLFRATTDMKIYERALRERGIPYYVLAGRGFYEREEIQDLLALLRFLENTTDELSLVAALRSPLFGLSDETLFWLRQAAEGRSRGLLDPHPLLTSLWEHEQVWGISPEERPRVARAAQLVRHLLEVRHRLPLVEILHEILRVTQFEAVQATAFDGHQRVANVRKLLELARAFESSGPHFLSDFTAFVQQFAEIAEESEAHVTTETADAIRIMTVHKAKGLEFPVVVIPDLARPFSREVPALLFDRAAGIGMKIPDRRGRLHETHSHARVLRHVRWREYFENQRLLFVAMTRARDYLMLSGAVTTLRRQKESEAREKMSWLEWITEILGLSEADSLPEIYEWNGLRIRLRIGRGESAEGREVKASTLMARYPQLERGEPLTEEHLPALSDSERAELERIRRRLEPVPLEPRVRPWPLAVTRLVALARCPLQFYYETVLDLPPWDEYEADQAPTRPGDRVESLLGPSAIEREKTFPPSLRGRIVHRFCEEYDGSEPWDAVLGRLLEEMIVGGEPHDRLVGDSDQNVATAPKDESEGESSPLDAEIAAGSPHRIAQDVPDVQTLREAAFAEIRPLVQSYMRSDLYREIERIVWQKRGGRVESEWAFLYRARGGLIRGRVDKLIVSEDGSAWIVDFKTNRIGSRDLLETLVREYTLQMQIYALAVRRAWRPRALRVELYFLQPDVRVPISEDQVEETAVAALVDELTDQAARGRRRQDFVARPDPDRCRRCPCFRFCPERAPIEETS